MLVAGLRTLKRERRQHLSHMTSFFHKATLDFMPADCALPIKENMCQLCAISTRTFREYHTLQIVNT